MSTEFENSNVDLEQLLRSKSWEQLTAQEREEVSHVLSGRDEYERMHAMTDQLMAGSGVHDEDIKPSAHLRENLLEAFAQEQKKRRALWWNSIRFRLNDIIRFDIPIVRIAFATVIVVAGVFGVMKLMENNNSQPIAKEEQQTPVHEKINPPSETPQNPSVKIENEHSGRAGEPDVLPQSNQNLIVQQPSVKNDVQVQDTMTNPVVTANPFANNNAIAFTQDSGMIIVPTVTNAVTVCCGASNGTLTATGGSNLTYSWTPENSNGVVNAGLPPRARSLENDAEVMDVFFALR